VSRFVEFPLVLTPVLELLPGDMIVRELYFGGLSATAVLVHGGAKCRSHST
jgi:hypothetical protein